METDDFDQRADQLARDIEAAIESTDTFLEQLPEFEKGARARQKNLPAKLDRVQT